MGQGHAQKAAHDEFCSPMRSGMLQGDGQNNGEELLSPDTQPLSSEPLFGNGSHSLCVWDASRNTGCCMDRQACKSS